MTRKTIAAVAAGLTLVAGQVAAQATSAAPPVQDRLGSEGAAPAGAQAAGLPFAVLFVAGFAGMMAASHDDDSESD